MKKTKKTKKTGATPAQLVKARAALRKAGLSTEKAQTAADRTDYRLRSAKERERAAEKVYLIACGWEVITVFRGAERWHQMWETLYKRPKGVTHHSQHGAMQRQHKTDTKKRRTG